jgi:hypothetical protein
MGGGMGKSEKVRGTWGVCRYGGVFTYKISEIEVVYLKALNFLEKSSLNAGTELAFLRILKGRIEYPRIPWPVEEKCCCIMRQSGMKNGSHLE